MIKKFSVVGILVFSLALLGDHVSAQYDGSGTTSVYTNNQGNDDTDYRYRVRSTPDHHIRRSVWDSIWSTDNRDSTPEGEGILRTNSGKYQTTRTTAVAPSRRNLDWIGLLGLAGLAGLGGKNRNTNRQRQT